MKAEEDRKHYAYMLLCADGSVYSGYATDAERRAADHNCGRGAKYTRSRLPVELVFSECFSTKSEALKREAALKKLSHDEKLLLISQDSERIKNMIHIEEEIRRRLFELQDPKYKEFSAKLMPTVNPEAVIGVRTPALRKLAKEYSQTPQAEAFLAILLHQYYEENNLHGFLIETIKDYETAIEAVEAFLPYIDNWATCDLVSPKVFKKHLPELYEKIKIWLQSDKIYTVRFGVGMLMSFYLDDAFLPEMPELVAGIRSEEYYVNMMIAWYFATALVKQPDTAMSFIQKKRLGKWTHNKTIQKAIESYRISDEMKADLQTMKMK